jgi:hypothetical protein
VGSGCSKRRPPCEHHNCLLAITFPGINPPCRKPVESKRETFHTWSAGLHAPISAISFPTFKSHRRRSPEAKRGEYSHLGGGCQERRRPRRHHQLLDHVSNLGLDGGQHLSDGFGLGGDVDQNFGHGGSSSGGAVGTLWVPTVREEMVQDRKGDLEMKFREHVDTTFFGRIEKQRYGQRASDRVGMWDILKVGEEVNRERDNHLEPRRLNTGKLWLYGMFLGYLAALRKDSVTTADKLVLGDRNSGQASGRRKQGPP